MRNTLNWLAQHARSVASAVCGGALLFPSNFLAAQMQIIMLSEEAPAAATSIGRTARRSRPGER